MPGNRAFKLGAIAVLVFAAAATAQIVEYTVDVGDSPNALAVSETNSTVYVSCEGIDSVYVLDATADAPEEAVVAKLPVGDYPVDVVWNPTDNTMWVVSKEINAGAGTVTVIDCANNSTITSLAVGPKPVKALYASAGNKIYTLEIEGSTVTAIDCANRQVVGSIAIPEPDRQWGFFDIAYNPVMDRLYIIAKRVGNPGKLYIVDCVTDQIVQTIGTAFGPVVVGYASSANRAFVACNDQQTMNVVDCSTNTILGWLPIYTDPKDFVWAQDATDRIWLACAWGSAVHYMRADLVGIEGRVDTPEKQPSVLLYNHTTTKVFAANELTHDVTVINGRIPRVITTIPVGHGPKALALHAPNKRVYVANYWEHGPGKVTVLKDFVGIEESPGRTTPLPTRAIPNPVGAGSKVMLQTSAFQPTQATVVDATGRTVYSGELGRGGAVTAPGETGVYFYTVTDGRLTTSGKFAVR